MFLYSVRYDHITVICQMFQLICLLICIPHPNFVGATDAHRPAGLVCFRLVCLSEILSDTLLREKNLEKV